MEASRFTGKRDQTLSLLAPAGTPYERILIVGFGKSADLDAVRLQGLGGSIAAALSATGHGGAFVAVDALDGSPLSSPEMAVELGFGLLLRSYRFDKYFTRQKDEDRPTLAEVTFGSSEPEHARMQFGPKEDVADAVAFTRDLVSEPANVVYPESFAEAARKLDALGLEVDVLGEKEMKRLGMNTPWRWARAATGSPNSSWCNGGDLANRRPRSRRRGRMTTRVGRWPSSARASPSTPAVSPSSLPPVWRR